MDQVLITLEGEASALVCRITDQKGTWLCLKETHEKLFTFLPRQTFLNQLNRQASKQTWIDTTREATDDEKGFMRLTGAIKTRAKSVKLLHIEQAIEAAKKLSLKVSLQSGIASIVSCQAYDASQASAQNQAIQAAQTADSQSTETTETGKHHKHTCSIGCVT